MMESQYIFFWADENIFKYVYRIENYRIKRSQNEQCLKKLLQEFSSEK